MLKLQGKAAPTRKAQPCGEGAAISERQSLSAQRSGGAARKPNWAGTGKSILLSYFLRIV
jgi:hypothetical protein